MDNALEVVHLTRSYLKCTLNLKLTLVLDNKVMDAAAVCRLDIIHPHPCIFFPVLQIDASFEEGTQQQLWC